MNLTEAQLGLLLTQIPLLPLAGAATLWGGAWCGLRTAGKSIALLAAGLSLVAIVAALLLPGAGADPRTLMAVRWLVLRPGAGGAIDVSLRWDGLAAVWLTVQTAAALLVLSCVTERRHDGGRARSTAAWSLALLGLLDLLVLAGNYGQLFVCWELSLVAAWRLLAAATDEADARAAQRMLWTGLIGDLPLLVALLAIWQAFGSFEFAAVLPDAAGTRDAIPDVMQGFAAFCLVIAALVRCAQFPACNWLPLAAGARAAPALWATLIGVVPAGMFLLLRSAPLLAANPAALSLLVNWGCLSAAVWGCLALTQPDARRALAAFVAGTLGLACAGVGAAGEYGPAAATYLACNLIVIPAALLCSLRCAAPAASRAPRAPGGLGALFLATALASGVWGQEAVLRELWGPGDVVAGTPNQTVAVEPADSMPPGVADGASPAAPLAAVLAHLLLSLGLFGALRRGDAAPSDAEADPSPPPSGGEAGRLAALNLSALFVPVLFALRPQLSGGHAADSGAVADVIVRLCMPGMTSLVMLLALLLAWFISQASGDATAHSRRPRGSLARLSRRGFYVDEAFWICWGLPLWIAANVFRFLELHVWEWEPHSGDDGVGRASDVDADAAATGRSLTPVLALFVAAAAVLIVLLLEG